MFLQVILDASFDLVVVGHAGTVDPVEPVEPVAESIVIHEELNVF